jgi:hypothetical protein
MAKKRIPNLELEEAEILQFGTFKNFSGIVDQYNPKGLSQFNVVLDFETADQLLAEGGNVKQLDPREEGDVAIPYLPCSINFDSNVPPTVYMTTGKHKKKTRLTKETISCLDALDVEYVDLIISAYPWEIKTKNGVDSGIKAYVKVMYANVIEDRFASKYADEDEN